MDKEVGSELEAINKLRGFCEDGWCTRNVDFEIRTLQEGIIIINGYYPSIIDGHQNIEIRAGRKKYLFTINEDKFEIRIQTDKDCLVRISMVCSFAQKYSEEDIRELAFVVQDIKAI